MKGVSDDIWVFAYGSLMWDPGFEYLEAAPALLRGYHRAFCVYSHVYRGTSARPGLVLGLDRGGACKGMAFRVAAGKAAAVLVYLDKREKVTDVYHRRIVPVATSAGRVMAHAYVVDRGHDQYAGKLTPERAAALIAQGVGRSGANPEYLENTVRHLDELGITDGPLHKLQAMVRRMVGG